MSDISQTKSRWWLFIIRWYKWMCFVYIWLHCKQNNLHITFYLCDAFLNTLYIKGYTCVKVKVSQLCLTVCDPMDHTVHGVLQARTPEWVVVSFCRGSSQPRDHTQVSWHAGRFFTIWTTREFSIKLSQCYILSIKWQQHQTLLSRAYAISYVEQCCDMLTLTSLHWNSVSDKQTQLWSDNNQHLVTSISS